MKVLKTLLHANSFLSILILLLSSFDRRMRVEKTVIGNLAFQLSSTLMQLLFSFDQDMRTEKTLTQTLVSQLLFTLMQLVLVGPGVGQER